MINLGNIADVVQFFIQDDSIYERLKADFPEILADLITFKSNPNCTCRGRVIKYFTDQITLNANILDKYVTNQNALNNYLSHIQNQKFLNLYAGKVLTVQKGEEAWADFNRSLTGKMFRGFSVVEKEDHLLVYFL